MEYDNEKIDEVVLAMLYLTTFRDGPLLRAWKGLDWEALNRLHEKGYIHDSRNKAMSVALTNEGAALSEELFRRHFGSQ